MTYYSVSSITAVSLDAVSLILSALDEREYGWLQESGAVAELWAASRLAITSLAATFLSGGAAHPAPPSAEAKERWRRRYRVALRRLQQAGIRTVADEQAGARHYVALRAEWDGVVGQLASALAYTREEIDPGGHAPGADGEGTADDDGAGARAVPGGAPGGARSPPLDRFQLAAAGSVPPLRKRGPAVFPTLRFSRASVARLCRAERGGPGFASGSEPDPSRYKVGTGRWRSIRSPAPSSFGFFGKRGASAAPRRPAAGFWRAAARVRSRTPGSKRRAVRPAIAASAS